MATPPPHSPPPPPIQADTPALKQPPQHSKHPITKPPASPIAQTGTTDGSGNLLTTEAGSTSTFTVVLDSKPTADVTVSITGADSTEHSLSASSLTFTTSNWNTAQTVTVTGVDDSIDDGDTTTTLTATASNSGGYAGTETATTTLKTSDNDTAGISITQTGTTDGSGNLLTTEAGSTSTFTVVLDAKPTADVTVSITGADSTEHPQRLIADIHNQQLEYRSNRHRHRRRRQHR